MPKEQAGVFVLVYEVLRRTKEKCDEGHDVYKVMECKIEWFSTDSKMRAKMLYLEHKFKDVVVVRVSGRAEDGDTALELLTIFEKMVDKRR